jgi:hypothetical protein
MDAENSVRGIARNYRMCINCVDNSKKLRNVHLNAATNIPALLTNMLERKARSEDFKPYMNDRESKQRQEKPATAGFDHIFSMGNIEIERPSLPTGRFQMESSRGVKQCRGHALVQKNVVPQASDGQARRSDAFIESKCNASSWTETRHQGGSRSISGCENVFKDLVVYS